MQPTRKSVMKKYDAAWTGFSVITKRRYISAKNKRGPISLKTPKFERFSHEKFQVSRILNNIDKQKSYSTFKIAKIHPDCFSETLISEKARETLPEQVREVGN